MEYAIGTKFLPRWKNAVVCEVIDIHTTRNLAGRVVKQEYLCTHAFLGQQVRHMECAVTIARGIDNLKVKQTA